MFKVFRDLEKGEKIIAFGDTAVGGSDYCVTQFLSVDKLDFPLVYRSRTIATDMTNAIVPALGIICHQTGIKPLIAYERNNGGAFEMDRIAQLNRDNLYTVYETQKFGNQIETSENSHRLGWDTNSATRDMMLGNFKEAIDHNLVRIYDEDSITELFSFVVVKTTASWKAQAEKGSHDDCVMAMAGAWQIKLMSPYFSSLRHVQPVRRPRQFDKVTGRLLS